MQNRYFWQKKKKYNFFTPHGGAIVRFVSFSPFSYAKKTGLKMEALRENCVSLKIRGGANGGENNFSWREKTKICAWFFFMNNSGWTFEECSGNLNSGRKLL